MKYFIFLLIASISFFSCNVISGNGEVQNEKREIPTIHTVKTSGSIDIEIKSGDTYSILVEDDKNLLPYIVTEVKNGVLNIHYKNGYNISNSHAKIFVTAPTLDKIVTSGSGNINGSGILKNANQILFDLTGAGDIDLQIDAPSIKVSGSGSGNVTLSGQTKDFECKLSGSGDANCSNLQSENTTISLSGSGNAHVFASVHLKASTSGSGDILYVGNPLSPEIHSSGSGTVQAQK